MKWVLPLAAVGEIATGLVLLIVPSFVGELLLGGALTGPAVPPARVAGIALIGLGLTCWQNTPLVGMLAYSALVTLYLAYFGLMEGTAGPFLWPAVVFHALLSILLVWAWLDTRPS